MFKPGEASMDLTDGRRRSIGLRLPRLRSRRWASKPPGAALARHPDFGYSPWSPGRADTAQVKVPCSGRNPNSAGCVGQSPSPALAWTFPRTAMRSFVILKGDPAGRADFGVKHRAAWASRPSPRLPDSVTAKCASSADVTLARDGPTHRRRRPGASCDGWMRCFPVEPPCATAFGDTAA